MGMGFQAKSGGAPFSAPSSRTMVADMLPGTMRIGMGFQAKSPGGPCAQHSPMAFAGSMLPGPMDMGRWLQAQSCGVPFEHSPTLADSEIAARAIGLDAKAKTPPARREGFPPRREAPPPPPPKRHPPQNRPPPAPNRPPPAPNRPPPPTPSERAARKQQREIEVTPDSAYKRHKPHKQKKRRKLKTVCIDDEAVSIDDSSDSKSPAPSRAAAEEASVHAARAVPRQPCHPPQPPPARLLQNGPSSLSDSRAGQVATGLSKGREPKKHIKEICIKDFS